MGSPLQNALSALTERFGAYLPNLVAGLVLLILGWLLGWLLKRIVVRILAVFRIDRLLRRFRWGDGFDKADVRYAIIEYAGNAVFVALFLVFLNASLEALQLTALSSLIQQGVLFIPRLVIAVVVLAFGWIVAGWVAGSIQKALLKEDVPRPTLIARFAKLVIVLFASAMALAEIDVAREVVIVGFGVAMVTLGALAVVMVSIGGKGFASQILDGGEREDRGATQVERGGRRAGQHRSPARKGKKG
jgi:hypothetical protein